jgi:hypothetical protein
MAEISPGNSDFLDRVSVGCSGTQRAGTSRCRTSILSQQDDVFWRNKSALVVLSPVAPKGCRFYERRAILICLLGKLPQCGDV